MYNIDFIALILQLSLDVIAAISLIIYLASTYSWEKNSPLEAAAEADFNEMRDKMQIKTGNAFFGEQDTLCFTRNENSVSLLKGDGDQSNQDESDRRIRIGGLDLTAIPMSKANAPTFSTRQQQRMLM